MLLTNFFEKIKIFFTAIKLLENWYLYPLVYFKFILIYTSFIYSHLASRSLASVDPTLSFQGKIMLACGTPFLLGAFWLGAALAGSGCADSLQ